MNNLWKGIAIAGMWASVSLCYIYTSNLVSGIWVLCFLATLAVAVAGTNPKN
jgi:hypothetical protein